jgi:hypothetical protein
MTGRRLSLGILASLGVLALGAWAWRAIGAGRGGALASPAIAIEATIAEIEAGRRTTPLVGEPAAGGERVVTFLARQEGGQPPRIVSDVTGWGEHVDETFDFSGGTMARVGQSDWYLLRAEVAPRARIEYLIAYGQADDRLEPFHRVRVEEADGGGRHTDRTPREVTLLREGQQEVLDLRGVEGVRRLVVGPGQVRQGGEG